MYKLLTRRALICQCLQLCKAVPRGIAIHSRLRATWQRTLRHASCVETLLELCFDFLLISTDCVIFYIFEPI